MNLQEQVTRLAAAQVNLQEQVTRLAAAQACTEERLGRLETVIAELAAAQTQFLEQLARLDERYDKMRIRQDSMWGNLLELRYVRRAAGLFGQVICKGRVFVPGQNLPDDFEAALAAALSPEEYAEARLLDAIMFGRLAAPYQPVGADVVLAIEVSGIIGGEDVTRAYQRAGLVRKAGYRCVPVVAGGAVAEDATRLLNQLPVVLALNGRSEGWERVLTVSAPAEGTETPREA